MTYNKGEGRKKELYQRLRWQAKLNIGMLHEYAEREITPFLDDDKNESTQSSTHFDRFKNKLVDRTIVSKFHFEKLITSMEIGLSDAIVPPRRRVRNAN